MKRLLQHLVIYVYIASTLSGFSYALFRYKMPGMPRFFWQWSYGMMAPYQTYRTINEELVALGYTEGRGWEAIDLRPYLPYVRGERAMRSYLISFRMQGPDVWPKKYQEYAQRIRAVEATHGREWDAIKLELEKWPASPGGYEFLRIDPFIERTFLATTP